MANGQIKRSAKKVFVNGEKEISKSLTDGDRVTTAPARCASEQPRRTHG